MVRKRMAGSSNDRLRDTIPQNVRSRARHRQRGLARRDQHDGVGLDCVENTCGLCVEEKRCGIDGINRRAENAKRVITELRERRTQ